MENNKVEFKEKMILPELVDELSIDILDGLSLRFSMFLFLKFLKCCVGCCPAERETKKLIMIF